MLVKLTYMYMICNRFELNLIKFNQRNFATPKQNETIQYSVGQFDQIRIEIN